MAKKDCPSAKLAGTFSYFLLRTNHTRGHESSILYHLLEGNSCSWGPAHLWSVSLQRRKKHNEAQKTPFKNTPSANLSMTLSGHPHFPDEKWFQREENRTQVQGIGQKNQPSKGTTLES
jgi:hypothetical protein